MREYYNFLKVEDFFRLKCLLYRKCNFVYKNYELWVGNSCIESKVV